MQICIVKSVTNKKLRSGRNARTMLSRLYISKLFVATDMLRLTVLGWCVCGGDDGHKEHDKCVSVGMGVGGSRGPLSPFHPSGTLCVAVVLTLIRGGFVFPAPAGLSRRWGSGLLARQGVLHLGVCTCALCMRDVSVRQSSCSWFSGGAGCIQFVVGLLCSMPRGQ